MKRFEAAVEASRLRLRAILMTSFAFILSMVPLVISSGAGAEMRQALATAVSFGMLGVTFFGLILTPVFYVVILWLTEFARGEQRAQHPAAVHGKGGQHVEEHRKTLTAANRARNEPPGTLSLLDRHLSDFKQGRPSANEVNAEKTQGGK